MINVTLIHVKQIFYFLRLFLFLVKPIGVKNYQDKGNKNALIFILYYEHYRKIEKGCIISVRQQSRPSFLTFNNNWAVNFYIYILVTYFQAGSNSERSDERGNSLPSICSHVFLVDDGRHRHFGTEINFQLALERKLVNFGGLL